ncbi:Serine/Threonine kinase, plant-type protein, putative [Medicago truncatula]|uniref:Serine/Threonine kinase, plant-type protein, putative n=1 Tax=Medicago truncatula TaxID=3880 RepID=G7IFH3_MEDTR|nr:Serine/Threonine kinase, plant-type protein, putative [Medicago truncatula]
MEWKGPLHLSSTEYNPPHLNWVREKKRSRCWVEEIMDPNIGTNCDSSKMEILAKVALKCVEVDKNIRPTMSQVVEKLQRNEIDS